MKRRYVFIAIVIVLLAIVTILALWFFNSSPRLDAADISSIQQYRMPSPPEIMTVYDRETIEQFVAHFNRLGFTPLLLMRFPSGGWYARNVIELKSSGMRYDIAFESTDDGDMLVKIHHRYYKVSVNSSEELLDIISNSTAAKTGGVTADDRTG